MEDKTFSFVMGFIHSTMNPLRGCSNLYEGKGRFFFAIFIVCFAGKEVIRTSGGFHESAMHLDVGSILENKPALCFGEEELKVRWKEE